MDGPPIVECSDVRTVSRVTYFATWEGLGRGNTRRWETIYVLYILYESWTPWRVWLEEQQILEVIMREVYEAH